jgi:hypothetical protein
LRDDCPDPEPVARVPKKYLALKADHADHPGPGLGPGARKRLEQALLEAA